MLTPYFGEFLVSPIPLELHLNYCSHLCAYCFANLNDTKRQANMKQVMALLSGYPNRKTLEAKLLQWGYPILFSNLVDPFAVTNARQAKPIIELCQQIEVPLSYQTKGAGKGAACAEALALAVEGPPAVWYISMASLDDAHRAEVEPGAPTIQSRLALMEQLRTKGHRVMLGLNPYVPEWCPDPEPLLRAAQQHGAEGVWIERLHLHYKQERNLKPREVAALTPGVIKRAKQRKTDPAEFQLLMGARQTAMDLGLEIYSVNQPTRSNFWDAYRQTYAHTFPVMQDFVNWCYDSDRRGTLITFEEFAQVMTPHLPTGRMPIDAYLGSVAHNLWWEAKIPAQMTYRQLLGIIWGNQKIKQCPARLPCFAWAAQWDAEEPAGWIQLVDGEGLPYLVFDPAGFDDYYAHVELPADAELTPVPTAVDNAGGVATLPTNTTAAL